MFFVGNRLIRKVGFLGVGKSNVGVFKYLSEHYGKFTTVLRARELKNVHGIDADCVYFKDGMLDEIEEDILFLSPSARRDVKELEEALSKGVVLSSDAEFFFDRCRADCYAVTGSDGKSTTTTIAARLLSEKYGKCIPCGNIGEAMTPHLSDGESVAFVTELSSFQLMYIKPKTEAALITNVSENHLNWHKDFSEYIGAKRNILENAKRRIFNFDCKISRALAKDYTPFAVFSGKMSENDLKKAVRADFYVTKDSGYITVSGERMLNSRDILAYSDHNVLNYMSAIALCLENFSKQHLVSVARTFGGLEHRCEYVGTFGGVRYYNSSIDSSPKRCIATLSSFDVKVILILCGRSKGLSYEELLPSLSKKTKLVIISGEIVKEIEPLLKNTSISYVIIDNFDDAIHYAQKTAKSGDTVLLSPAATSFDSFENFEKRGERFKNIVKKQET